MKQLLSPALLIAALLLGLAAWVVWFVSDAHGHGLASGDRRTVVGSFRQAS